MNDEGLYGHGQLCSLLRSRYCDPRIQSVVPSFDAPFFQAGLAVSLAHRYDPKLWRLLPSSIVYILAVWMVGSFTVTVRHRPRYVNAELCTGCGICQEKCPAKLVDEAFEAGSNVAEIIEACKRFPLNRRSRITFEYVMLAGVNDSPGDARRLAKLEGSRHAGCFPPGAG